MIQPLLKLIEANSIIEVNVKVPVGLGHALESVGYLQPYQIQNPLKRTALVIHVLRGWTTVGISTHEIEYIG